MSIMKLIVIVTLSICELKKKSIINFVLTTLPTVMKHGGYAVTELSI